MNPENQPYLISHAQNREDIILSGFFKDLEEGFYVDVGANDPALDSVTKYFYERSWSGINIEPIKRLHKKLKEARPRDINLNIGVSNREGKLKFREYKEYHGLSTFAKNVQGGYDKMAANNSSYSDYVEHEVEIKTLAQIFDELKPKIINFMKVDVEGYEYEVLSGNDWDKHRPQVICIEANHITHDWRPILEKARYDLVFFDGLNNYYVAKEAKEIKQSFSYVQTMLPTPIVDYRVVGIIDHYKKAKMAADANISLLNNEVHSFKHQLYVTQQELHELSRFRGLVKALLLKFDGIVQRIILPDSSPDLPVLTLQNTSVEVDDGSQAATIYRAVRDYDSRYLTKLNPPKHRLRYAVLRIYRKLTRHYLRAILKLVYRVLRQLRSLGRS